MAKEGSNWRPENWERTRGELANMPNVWSPGGPNLTHTEQIVEATASRIILEMHEASKATEFLPFKE